MSTVKRAPAFDDFKKQTHRTVCTDDERQFEIGRAAKAVFWRQSFSLSLEPPLHEVFWRYLRHLFARIWKIISPLNSANFSTSAVMDEINSRTRKFFGFLGSPFGVVEFWRVVCDPQKHPSEYIRFYTSITGLQEQFFLYRQCSG